MQGPSGLGAVAFASFGAIVLAQSSPSVVTITHSTCYDPSIASAPYTVVGNETSSGVLSATSPIPTTTLGPSGPSTPPYGDGTVTASYTTVLPDGSTEVVYDRLYQVTAADGSVSTVTEPLTTSTIASLSASSSVTSPAPIVSLGPSQTLTTQYTSMLSDGRSEVIFDRLYLVTLADGSVSTTTEGFSTSVLAPSTTPSTSAPSSIPLSEYITTQYTTVLPDGRSEVIFDRLLAVTAEDGSISTVTEPISTSLILDLPTSLTPLISTMTVVSTVPGPTTELITETSLATTTIDGTPTTVLTVSTFSTTYTASQTITETSLVPQISISGLPCVADPCMVAVNGLAESLEIVYEDCAAFQTTLVTPPIETYNATETVTSIETGVIETDTVQTTIISTSYLPYDPLGQAEVQTLTFKKRQADSTGTIPAYATDYCTASAQYASVCACIGITSTVYTLPTQTISSTSTSLTTTTTEVATSTTSYTSTTTYVTQTPTPFILLESGYKSGYVAVDEDGALYIDADASAAEPFFFGPGNIPRSFNNPALQWVDRYIPNSATSDNTMYLEELDSTINYPITCDYSASNVGDFWGGCQSTGMPNGNPNVYGFGTCPNEGRYIYMDPNSSNVKCYDGGYSFLGFYLEEYTPPTTDTSDSDTIGGQSDGDGGYVPDQGDSAPLTG